VQAKRDADSLRALCKLLAQVLQTLDMPMFELVASCPPLVTPQSANCHWGIKSRARAFLRENLTRYKSRSSRARSRMSHVCV